MFIGSLQNDIAILKFYEDVNIMGMPSLQFAKSWETFYEGETAWIAGWGAGNPSKYLNSAEVSILNFDRCKRNWRDIKGPEWIVTNNMICAGQWAGGVDACEK